ncbi:MAG: hypothetical protein JXC31_03085 [Acholeplasmataceae bacterium]|nr:hypothetical protein [Acholeplasmataceae bacterium]
MARAQSGSSKTNSKTKSTNKNPQKNVASKSKVFKANEKREPSKNEIMFYRIGIFVITITLVVLAIILVIQNSKIEPEANPYEDYLSVNVTELTYITQKDDYNVYGDFSYFNGKDEYADLRLVLNTNDYVYVYFYRSSAIDIDIKDAITDVVGLENMAFLFLDLDDTANSALFETAAIGHLGLDSTKDNMFLIFDINAQTFQLETRSSDIVIEINNL